MGLDGRLLSINTYHHRYGYINLSARAPFPDGLRYDQAAVRAYRAGLADPSAPAFGLEPKVSWALLSSGLVEDTVPASTLTAGPIEAHVITWSPVLDSGEKVPVAVQEWVFTNRSAEALDWSYVWGGTLCLARASFTQLTEGGIIPAPSPESSLTTDGDCLILHNKGLEAAVAILGIPQVESILDEDGVVHKLEAPAHLLLEPGGRCARSFVFSFGRDPQTAIAQAREAAGADFQSEREETYSLRRKQWSRMDMDLPPAVKVILHRSITYLLDCCALPVEETVCLIADHQILPLSWTRDAYYMAASLLAISLKCAPTSGQLPSSLLDLILRHLDWLFEKAQRPSGFWVRAYLPNGEPKDPAFQLDQQCYPLLELADFFARTGNEAILSRFQDDLPGILNSIFDHRSDQAYLFATDETPGDDPLTYPYHFSSQVLLWHTFHRLAKLPHLSKMVENGFEDLAKKMYRDILRHFTVNRKNGQLFAYATDLSGHHILYHDANDYPTVLAPLWGFCSRKDPTWLATMDFAFSPENQVGYSPGPFGGLGSQHTPGAWPLGDVQELIYAKIRGDSGRAGRALERLIRTACLDGSLPEARDPLTGSVVSRHWFAWPGSALLYALNLFVETNEGM